MAALIPFGGSWAAGLLGGGAAGLWALHNLRLGLLQDLFPSLRYVEPSTISAAGSAAKSYSKSSYARWNRLMQALGKNVVDAFLDLLQESVKDAALFPVATMALSDAIAYWVYSDLLVKSTYDSTLNIPTAQTFTAALNYILDSIAALLAVDVISNRDVGSDIAESIIDSFNQAVVGDSIRSYLNTIAGVDAVDDDEIRDIVGEGAVATADELAYLGARSGLDTYSAVAELYTGLLQGDNPYWNRVVQEINDNFKRVERGLALDIYGVGTLVEKAAGDLTDSVYWYLEAVDYIVNRVKTVVRDAGQVLVSASTGAISYDMAVEMLDNMQAEILAYEEMLKAFDDPQLVSALVGTVFDEYGRFMENVDVGRLYFRIEALLDDAGKRLAEYAKVAADAYTKLKDLRTVQVS